MTTRIGLSGKFFAPCASATCATPSAAIANHRTDPPSLQCMNTAPPESPNSTMCLVPLGGLGRRPRVPLAAAHAGDFHRLEQTGFAKRLLRRELLRRLAARHVDDEHAARPRLAVLGERPAGEHDDVLVALEVTEMRLARRVPDRLAVGSVFVDHDVEHAPPVKSVPLRPSSPAAPTGRTARPGHSSLQ